jgi:hypothetical protein
MKQNAHAAREVTPTSREYNYWDFNFFRVPDLQLVPE